jgi:hypothetical protein
MPTRDQKNASDLGEQAIALAKQLGRIAGTIEGTAESMMSRETLAEQLTRVRDGATQMLEGLTAGAERGRKAAATAVRSVPTSAKVTAGLAKARAYLTSGGGKPGGRKAKSAKPAPSAASRQADPSRAPGKRHRKPAPTINGVKKPDERIPKLRTAAANRQRRKSFA